MHTKYVALAIFASLVFYGARAGSAGESSGGVYLMASLGDSITAGTLADGHAKPGVTRPNLTPPFVKASPTAANGLAFFFETYAPNADIPFVGNMQNKATLSWSSGANINSHYMRLKTHVEQDLNGSLTVMNVSVPGEKSSGMLQEAQELVSAMQSGTFTSLKYVTFMIGANDACQGTDNQAFYTQIMQAFQTLAQIEQTEPIRILVSSLPDIASLGAANVDAMLTTGNVSCTYTRDVLGQECNTLTVWSTQAEYQQRVAIVQAKNQVIAQAVSDAKAQYPQLDLVYAASFWNTSILPAYLAADCFHPNQQGQQMLSDSLWADQPWWK